MPLLLVLLAAIVVEVLERRVGRPVPVTLLSAAMALLAGSGLERNMTHPAVWLGLVGAYLWCVLVVHLYRTRGVAPAALAVWTNWVIPTTVAARSLGDPDLATQSTLMSGLLAVLAVAGFIGLRRATARTKPIPATRIVRYTNSIDRHAPGCTGGRRYLLIALFGDQSGS
jgi:hypothetical protein